MFTVKVVLPPVAADTVAAVGLMVSTGAAPGFTTMPQASVAVFVALSVTCSVNAYEPAVVGVPEIDPAGLIVRPGGNVPLARLHVYGGTPPVADRSWR